MPIAEARIASSSAPKDMQYNYTRTTNMLERCHPPLPPPPPPYLVASGPSAKARRLKPKPCIIIQRSCHGPLPTLRRCVPRRNAKLLTMIGCPVPMFDAHPDQALVAQGSHANKADNRRRIRHATVWYAHNTATHIRTARMRIRKCTHACACAYASRRPN